MRIILLKDIKDLGKQFQEKEVSDGYARNFLIPRNLAKPATEAAVMRAQQEKQKEMTAAEADLARWQEIASKIDGLELAISVKVSEGGVPYGSVSDQKIAEALEGLGYPIERSWIALAHPLKELGEFPITITFPHGLEAQIKVIVEEEKETIRTV